MRSLGILLLALAAAAAIPRRSQRIVNGSATTIDQHPEMVVLIGSVTPEPFRHICGGTIINNRSILTAAHCLAPPFSDTLHPTSSVRARLGSSYRSSGGLVYNSREFFVYPGSLPDRYYDIAVIRVVGEIFQTDVIKYGTFSGPNYVVPDNAVLWAAGWGARYQEDPRGSDQLQHVQAYHVSREDCNRLIPEFHNFTRRVPPHQMCFGDPSVNVHDADGPSQCYGDSGGPLYHDGVVVGVCVEAPIGCGNPTINCRVSFYIEWIKMHM